MPDRFGKKRGPSWRTWSYLERDFVGLVHSVLKQAMRRAENRKCSIVASNVQDFRVSKEERNGPRVATGLKEKHWRYLVELNGNQAWNNGEDLLLCMTHLQLEEVWTTDSRQIFSSPKATKMDDLSYTFQAWENFEQ